MKLVIEIDENTYKRIQFLEPIRNSDKLLNILMCAVQDGTPLPKTNGKIIETLFPYETIGECGICYYMGGCEFSKFWWNAPYKADKGDKE